MNQDFQPLDDDNSDEIGYLEVEQKKKNLQLVVQEQSSIINLQKMKTLNKF